MPKRQKQYIGVMASEGFDLSGMKIIDEKTGKEIKYEVEKGELVLEGGKTKAMQLITLRLPKEDLVRVKRLAKKQKTSTSDILRLAIEKTLSESEGKGKNK